MRGYQQKVHAGDPVLMNFLLKLGLSAESSPRKPRYDELLAELGVISR